MGQSKPAVIWSYTRDHMFQEVNTFKAYGLGQRLDSLKLILPWSTNQLFCVCGHPEVDRICMGKSKTQGNRSCFGLLHIPMTPDDPSTVPSGLADTHETGLSSKPWFFHPWTSTKLAEKQTISSLPAASQGLPGWTTLHCL